MFPQFACNPCVPICRRKRGMRKWQHHRCVPIWLCNQCVPIWLRKGCVPVCPRTRGMRNWQRNRCVPIWVRKQIVAFGCATDVCPVASAIVVSAFGCTLYVSINDLLHTPPHHHLAPYYFPPAPSVARNHKYKIPPTNIRSPTGVHFIKTSTIKSYVTKK